MANNATPKLKAYVQVDSTGRVVSGTPVFRASKPKSGNWREIPLYYRGDNLPTTTTTTTGGGVTPTAFIKAYWLNTNDSCNTTTYGNLLFYSLATSLAPEIRIYTDASLTIPVQTGLVIYDAATMTRYVVGGAGLIYLYNCPQPTTTTTTTQGVNNSIFRQSDDSNTVCSTSNLVQLFWIGELTNGTQVFTDQALTQGYFVSGYVSNTATNAIFQTSNGYAFNAGFCPGITVTSSSNITSSSGDFTFTFNPSNGTASQVGVALSPFPNPTRNSITRNATMDTTTNPNTLTVGTLNPSTLYYVRGYIQIGMDTYYSSETTITTTA